MSHWTKFYDTIDCFNFSIVNFYIHLYVAAYQQHLHMESYFSSGIIEHLSSPSRFSVVRVTWSLVLCVCFVDSCLSFCSFLPLYCMFFFDLRILITTLVSSNSSQFLSWFLDRGLLLTAEPRVTLLEHTSLHPFFRVVCVAQSLVFCAVFCRSLSFFLLTIALSVLLRFTASG